MKKQLLAIASVAMIAGAISFSSCKKDDTTPPTLTVSGGNNQSQSLPSSAGAGTFTAPSATATDDKDGDLTSKIQVTGVSSVDANTKGVYTITYSVSDAAGNTATQDVTINIVNDVEFLAGTYAADDTCQQSWVTPYSMDWSADNGVNNKITINNLSNFGTGINIIGNVSGGNITLPAPQTIGTIGSLQNGSGTFTHNGSTVSATLVWTWTDGTNTEVCTTTAAK